MTRIFSGIQPSGELHIGNYLGAVKNWVALQRAAHRVALLRGGLPRHHRQLRPRSCCGSGAGTWPVSLLAAGIDPAKAALFVQSDVPEHTELSWIFTTNHAARRPRAADAVQGQVGDDGEHPGRAAHVPGAAGGRHPALPRRPRAGGRGPGAAPRALARYGAPVERAIRRGVLPRAAAAAHAHAPHPAGSTARPRCPSRSATPSACWRREEEIWQKLRPAVTDPQRVRKSDPGRPEVCNIFQLHKAFSPRRHGRRGGPQLPRGRRGGAWTARRCCSAT